MSIYQACQDVSASRRNEYMSNTGHSAGITYWRVDSYSSTVCARSDESVVDALVKLDAILNGYCATQGTVTCKREGGATVTRLGSFRLFVEKVIKGLNLNTFR